MTCVRVWTVCGEQARVLERREAKINRRLRLLKRLIREVRMLRRRASGESEGGTHDV